MRVLHLHSSFNAGGKELRAARLMNAFGAGVTHHILSAETDAYGATSAIAKGIDFAIPGDFPSLQGKPLPGRLQKIAQAMRVYDLVLTYNWGAMDGVMAHTLFRDLYRLPPVVHHEDGFNEDEANGLKTKRNWFRRVALARTSALVVPSKSLQAIALDAWQQPRSRVRLVSNGIDIAAYRKKPKPDALPRIVKRPGEKWVGTLAGLRAVKNLPRLVRAFAGLPEPWQLVILGEGPERDAIRAEAQRLDIAHRVHLPGFVPDPSKAVGLFDLFALSSDSEQFPISVVEAMAAGLAVASPQVGDVAEMVSGENQPFITPAGDETALAASLEALAADENLRRRIGDANRAHAEAHYDEKAMIAAYRAIYGTAMRRATFP